jgi:hypothetical protein
MARVARSLSISVRFVGCFSAMPSPFPDTSSGARKIPPILGYAELVGWRVCDLLSCAAGSFTTQAARAYRSLLREVSPRCPSRDRVAG